MIENTSNKVFIVFSVLIVLIIISLKAQTIIQGVLQLSGQTTTFSAGTGTGSIKASGIICSNLTNVTDAATQNTWNLITCTIPANTLVTNGDTLKVESWGLLAANANAKEYQLEYTATTDTCSGTNAAICLAGCNILDSNTTASAAAQGFMLEFVKTGATTHKASGYALTASSVQANTANAACTSTDTVDNQIVVGWRNTAAAAASIQNSSIIISLLPR